MLMRQSVPSLRTELISFRAIVVLISLSVGTYQIGLHRCHIQNDEAAAKIAQLKQLLEKEKSRNEELKTRLAQVANGQP